MAFGFLLGRMGTGATPEERRRADSTAAAARATDSLIILVRANQRRADSLLADSVMRAKARSATARAKTDTAWLALDTAAVTAPVRALLDTAKADLKAERIAADAHVATLEADTTEKAQHVREAWAMVATVVKQRDDVQKDLDDALARRTEPPITLGGSAGYGTTYANGRLNFGPSAVAGFTVRIKIPLPRWLGGAR